MASSRIKTPRSTPESRKAASEAKRVSKSRSTPESRRVASQAKRKPAISKYYERGGKYYFKQPSGVEQEASHTYVKGKKVYFHQTAQPTIREVERDVSGRKGYVTRSISKGLETKTVEYPTLGIKKVTEERRTATPGRTVKVTRTEDYIPDAGLIKKVSDVKTAEITTPLTAGLRKEDVEVLKPTIRVKEDVSFVDQFGLKQSVFQPTGEITVITQPTPEDIKITPYVDETTREQTAKDIQEKTGVSLEPFIAGEYGKQISVTPVTEQLLFIAPEIQEKIEAGKEVVDWSVYDPANPKYQFDKEALEETAETPFGIGAGKGKFFGDSINEQRFKADVEKALEKDVPVLIKATEGAIKDFEGSANILEKDISGYNEKLKEHNVDLEEVNKIQEDAQNTIDIYNDAYSQYQQGTLSWDIVQDRYNKALRSSEIANKEADKFNLESQNLEVEEKFLTGRVSDVEYLRNKAEKYSGDVSKLLEVAATGLEKSAKVDQLKRQSELYKEYRTDPDQPWYVRGMAGLGGVGTGVVKGLRGVAKVFGASPVREFKEDLSEQIMSYAKENPGYAAKLQEAKEQGKLKEFVVKATPFLKEPSRIPTPSYKRYIAKGIYDWDDPRNKEYKWTKNVDWKGVSETVNTALVIGAVTAPVFAGGKTAVQAFAKTKMAKLLGRSLVGATVVPTIAKGVTPYVALTKEERQFVVGKGRRGDFKEAMNAGWREANAYYAKRPWVVKWAQQIAAVPLVSKNSKEQFQLGVMRYWKDKGMEGKDLEMAVRSTMVQRAAGLWGETAGVLAANVLSEIYGQKMLTEAIRATGKGSFGIAFREVGKAGIVEGVSSELATEIGRYEQIRPKQVAVAGVAGGVSAGIIGGVIAKLRIPKVGDKILPPGKRIKRLARAIEISTYIADPWEKPGDIIAGKLGKGLAKKIPVIAPTPVSITKEAVVPTKVPTMIKTPIGIPSDVMVKVGAPTVAPTSIKTALSRITVPVMTPIPTGIPTTVPTGVPIGIPTGISAPTQIPTQIPTTVPTFVPTGVPTGVPIGVPVAAAGLPIGALPIPMQRSKKLSRYQSWVVTNPIRDLGREFLRKRMIATSVPEMQRGGNIVYMRPPTPTERADAAVDRMFGRLSKLSPDKVKSIVR